MVQNYIFIKRDLRSFYFNRRKRRVKIGSLVDPLIFYLCWPRKSRIYPENVKFDPPWKEKTRWDHPIPKRRMKNDDPEPPVVQNIPALGTVIFPTTGKKNRTVVQDWKLFQDQRKKLKKKPANTNTIQWNQNFSAKGFHVHIGIPCTPALSQEVEITNYKVSLQYSL